MKKTILLTGASDGIGLEVAKMLAPMGHALVLHGRNRAKLDAVAADLAVLAPKSEVSVQVADLSVLADVERLVASILEDHPTLDVVINNAGVFGAPETRTKDGLDIRFMVNTIAPYCLTRWLLGIMPATGRIVNVSSAAQAPVDPKAIAAAPRLSDGEAYAQSKLAITMWTRALAEELGAAGPSVVAVNPASLLGSKMVKDAYGIAGGDLSVGADILVRAALSEEFEGKSGQYYDNDERRFAAPHPDAMNGRKVEAVMEVLDSMVDRLP